MQIHDLTRPAVPLGLAGAAWWLAQTLSPDMGAEMGARLVAVAAAPDSQAAAGLLLFVAGVSLVLSALALVRRLPEGRGRRLVGVGTALVALGGVWLAAGRGSFAMVMLMAADPGVDHDAAVAVMSGSPGFAFVGLLPTLPALLLGPVLLAVGLRRAGLAGWGPLVLWVVGLGTFLGTQLTVKAGESLGIGLAALALAWVGAAASRDREVTPAGAPAGRPSAAGRW